MTFIVSYDGWALDYGILEDSDEEEITQAAWNAALEEAVKMVAHELDWIDTTSLCEEIRALQCSSPASK